MNISAVIVSSSTNNQPILIKIPKMENKTEYEVSDATKTDHSHYEKLTEYTKDKETSSIIEDVDSLVQIYIYQTFNIFEFPEQGY